RTWNYIRDHLDQRTQTYLRLQSHGGFDAVHRYTLVCCLGAPYVRYRDEPIPGVDLHAADAYYRRAFGRKNLQLRHYPMARQYPVYTGYAVFHWNGILLPHGRNYGHLPGQLSH